MDSEVLKPSIVKELLENAVCDYFAVNTWFNYLFHKDVIKSHKKELFKKYQLACFQFNINGDIELGELIEDVEQDLL